MSALPISTIDYVSIWEGLPPLTRDAIGVLAIKEAALRFAAGTYQGDEPGEGVAYLLRDDREAAEAEADNVAAILRQEIEADLPDLFGQSPSPEHPNGTDPTWATPIRFRCPEPEAP